MRGDCGVADGHAEYDDQDLAELASLGREAGVTPESRRRRAEMSTVGILRPGPAFAKAAVHHQELLIR
jgi:hypothetical protein